MIILNSIQKKFGDNVIFNNLSYKFYDKGLYVLFGPSGSGKTTMLNIIMGLIDFDFGSVSIFDNTYKKSVDSDFAINCISYITQESYFIDYLTVFDNLKLCMNKENETYILDLLKKFELDRTKDNYPFQLSGGEKQRLAIIQSILQEKKILILDEPTSALDFDNKEKIFKILSNLKNEMLIICSSHDERILDFADNIIDFNNLSNNSKEFCKEKKDETVIFNSKNKSSKSSLKVLHYMLKQKKYRFRDKKASIVMISILVMSLLILFSCYNYKEKLLQSLIDKYNVNYVTVYCPLTTNDYCQSIFKKYNVSRSSYVYDLNTPQEFDFKTETIGQSVIGQDINFNTEIKTLPSDSSFFPYNDSILYGTYFTDKNQVILGYEFAHEMNNDVSKLIGKTLSLKLPDCEDTFTIVGVLKKLGKFDGTYFKSNMGNANLNQYVFINDDYTNKYLYDDVLGYSENATNSTVLYAYFDNHRDLYNFYKKYVNKKYGEGIVVEDFSYIFIDYMHSIQTLQMISYPLIIVIIIISLIFYFQIKYIESKYTKHIICVYQYYGYKYNKIKKAIILYYLIDMTIIFILSLIIASFLMVILNHINNIFNIFSFKVFLFDLRSTFDLYISLLFSSLIISIFIIITIKSSGWYNMLKRRSDLL